MRVVNSYYCKRHVNCRMKASLGQERKGKDTRTQCTESKHNKKHKTGLSDQLFKGQLKVPDLYVCDRMQCIHETSFIFPDLTLSRHTQQTCGQNGKSDTVEIHSKYIRLCEMNLNRTWTIQQRNALSYEALVICER